MKRSGKSRPKSGWWWNGEKVAVRDFFALAAKRAREQGMEIADEDYIIMVEKTGGPFANYKGNHAWRMEQWRKMRQWFLDYGDDAW